MFGKFLFVFLIYSVFSKKEEVKKDAVQKTKEEIKKYKEEKLKKREEILASLNKNVINPKNISIDDNTELPGGKIYELGDSTFDLFIRNGKKYKWFVIFYIKTCGHCRRAKLEINKILPEIKDPKIRFAQVDSDKNMMSAIRFNTTHIPYIVLIENNKMFELMKYPNSKNLKEFLNTTFSEVEEDLVEIPKRIGMATVGMVLIKEAFESLRRFLMRKTGKELNKFHVILIVVLAVALFAYAEYKFLSWCCNDDLDKEFLKKLQEKQLEQGEEEEGEEVEGEEEEDD
ncbi:MAG: protein disulfide isomerase family protein, partial [archaeon]|nr:protein disulfide isomerase family protein [archaeon]